ncbi:MAG: glycosyltransferase family 4 protein [Bacilli bacterium]|nr:glycosyltransferase family 4 protein [Bacilli bacterium]
MKKILYITEQSPFETYSGAHQRTSLLYKSLCKLGTVDLICFTNDTPPNYISTEHQNSITFIKPVSSNFKYNKFISGIISLFSFDCISSVNKIYEEIVNETINNVNYDYVVIRYIQTALKCGITKGDNVVIDIDDLPEQYFTSLYLNKQYSFLKKLYYYLRIKSTKVFTKKILKNIYHSFIPNKKQIAFPNTSYLPNIPYTFFDRIKCSSVNNVQNMLFVGLMSWYPNYNGIDYFLKNIFPKVKSKLPNVTFNIVGKNLPIDKKNSWELDNSINIKGFIENIENEYDENAIVVIPIYEGAGSNIKVLEAMKYGKTTVLSLHATRGYEDLLCDFDNTLIAKNDNDFAEKIILALTDHQLRLKIGTRAKDTINSYFSFDFFCEIVKKVIS